MSGELRPVDLLSREELDALLSDLSASRAEDGAVSLLAEPFRRTRHLRTQPRPPKLPRLRSAVEDAAAAWGKRLSSRHERRIGCSLIGWEVVETGSFVETLLETDRALHFETLPSRMGGFVLLARPLVFALLTLECGGCRSGERTPPARDYTQIERRFMGRVAGSLLEELGERWRPWCATTARPGALVPGAAILERVPETILLANLDFTGLGAVARLRIGFPQPPFQISEAEGSPPSRTGAPEIESSIAKLQVTLRAEVGSTELPLSRLSSLEPGDLLPLQPSASEGLVVRVDGAPKFRAVQGTLGGRRAVQVLERIGGEK